MFRRAGAGPAIIATDRLLRRTIWEKIHIALPAVAVLALDEFRPDVKFRQDTDLIEAAELGLP